MIPNISAPIALPIAIPTIPPVETELSLLLDETLVEVTNGAALVVLADNIAAVILLPKQPSLAQGLIKQQPMNAVGVNSQVYQDPVDTHACCCMSP